MWEAFESAGERLDIPVIIDDSVWPHADAWRFAKRGIPAVNVASKTDSRDRGWGHTHADTLDKLDWRDVRDLGIAVTAAVFELAATDRSLEPKDSDELEAMLDRDYGAEVTVGEWSYE